MVHDLTPDTVKNYHNELWHTPKGKFLKDIIFGANDGIVTTVAFMIATIHAISDTTTLIWVVIIEVIAGALSMGAGAFMAKRTESLFFQNELNRETYEIEHSPQHEINEVKEFFEEYGFNPEERDMATNRIISDKKRWLRFMMKEEFGVHDTHFESGIQSGIVMTLSFLLGALPLVIPILFWGHVPEAVALLGMILLFTTGLLRYKFTNQKPFWAGIENVTLGIVIMAISELLGRYAHTLMN
jgi:vacuolar iron transporter family protein